MTKEKDCKRCENSGQINVYDGIGFPKVGWCPSCEPKLSALEKAEKKK